MLKTPTRLAGTLTFIAVSLLIGGHAFSQPGLDLLNAKPGQPLPRLPDGIIRHGNSPPISPRRSESTNVVRQEVRDQPSSAWLGVTPASMGGTSQTVGALVVNVFPGSPAAISQLRRGDVILAVDDKELEVGSEPAALAQIVASHAIGTTVRLKIVRGGRQSEVPVTLASKPVASSGNPELESEIRGICPPRITQGADQTQVRSTTADTFCMIAFRGAKTKDNEPFFQKLTEILGPCGTTHTMAQESRAKVYQFKPAIDITDEDLGSILRRTIKCAFERETGTPDAVAIHFASDRLVATYVADRENAISEFVQNRRMVEQAKLETERRDAHVTELTRAGYLPVGLSELKVDARSLHGKKVAVSGLLFVLNNDSAVLLKDERDENPVVVALKDASRETRRATIGNCDNRSRGCRIEIRGTVIGTGSLVGIRAD
ncbi:PDZ domain-containing protein [Bradyrhizobium sp. AUGA SZCCT0431]|uniref:PDZ domain-containing protein n=1 Tax=Bradyrhizobium sp. AUGA SZCCT0431 TaxID=2807674 RepID=UPI001BAC3F37|nr:PDZ domain-containing protein [Bradyrhizobium sp. AUGA SZCCT0431]MBR1148937.1 PDZ domain-containing protein [Bradyrhizobium sp. AUGA SZCCT0431]